MTNLMIERNGKISLICIYLKIKKNFLKIKEKSRFLNKIIWNLWLIYEKNQNQNKNLSFFSLI